MADSPSIVVDVEDQFGNIVTSDSSNVTLAVASGPGSTSGTLTVAASGGIATFSNIKLDTAGNYTLTASDGSLTTADIEQLHGIRGGGVEAGLQCPAEQRHGRSRRQPVHRRRCGRPVREHRHHGQLQRDAGGRQRAPAAASGTLTVAASSGIATFSNIKLDTAGNYTLTASDGSLTTATSNSFTVSRGRGVEARLRRPAEQRHGGSRRQPVDRRGRGRPVRQHRHHGQLQRDARGGQRPWQPERHLDGRGQRRRRDLQQREARHRRQLHADRQRRQPDHGDLEQLHGLCGRGVEGGVRRPAEQCDGRSRRQPVDLVDVEDQFGNIVTTDSSNVTLSVASGPGSLSGTVTVAASGGVATFSNVKLDTAGSYTLTASDGALTTTTSNSFTVAENHVVPTVAVNASATPNPIVGTTTNLSVLGDDDGGESNLTYNWTATAQPTGSNPLFSINGTNAAKNSTVTFKEAGSYTFTCTISDGQGGTVTSSVNVTVDQTLASIAVVANPAQTISTGGELLLTAVESDQFGHLMAQQSPVGWSVDSGNGTVGSDGIFIASDQSETDVVRATIGEISDTIALTVSKVIPPVFVPPINPAPPRPTGVAWTEQRQSNDFARRWRVRRIRRHTLRADRRASSIRPNPLGPFELDS